MQEQFNVSIFTEDQIGMLNRVSIIFNRRHINIESITTPATTACMRGAVSVG